MTKSNPKTLPFRKTFASLPRRGDDGELVAHEAEQQAIREMVALRTQGKPLRIIADIVRAKGSTISHQGVADVVKAASFSRAS